MKRVTLLFSSVLLCLAVTLFAKESTEGPLSSKTFSGLKFRSIGPALMSGRIADIAIHPQDRNTWYIAVASGGVWKTTNRGVTWKPLFDKQNSYSIGCVTIDPNNPHTVWVGTGENVGGRHAGWGDGLYRSDDDGASWKNMGLKNSEHISKIIVHPKNSDVLWVAAQGPLWNKGGERGLYKTKDGGKTWKRVLGDAAWIGATDVVIDPRDPDRLYAATWQRHRTIAAYMGGGPGTALYKSTDGGESWSKLKKGLPKSNLGKIGLAISPQNPDVLYAAIELDRRTGAVYKSVNRGASWKKQSETTSGGTGPHYYQELYASPHKFDRIYLMNVRTLISEDGGKSFNRMKEKHKHSDNHAMAFVPDDPDYLLFGCDGGLYESYDDAENWRFVANLPITQFYKVAVDDAEPFYNIYGGAQDNNTQGGPSRTDNYSGIRNADWFITLWGDGYQPATEPGNPNILYSEWQEGSLTRYDRSTGEIVFIQPQPGKNEPPERFNWDAPILVSPHSPQRIYYASQRVWRSDNRGDSWQAISADLTRNQERIALPIMGKTWSWDSPWDVLAMSQFNTIASLAESPVKEGVIYAGTDDGIIQVTEDGGANWRKILTEKLPNAPANAFINDIKADLYQANTVYVILDNHKTGDFKPYLYKSTNAGKSWTSIAGDLPKNTILWRVVQDHINANLLFAATEYGIYFTIDGGKKWVQLKGNVPTIAFRDLVIQRRENDLVCASFGRGFYILDDYSALRELTPAKLQQDAVMFSTRKAWWYIQRPALDFGGIGSQGAAYFAAPNPPFGAVFTFYLKDRMKTAKEIRSEKEKKLIKKNMNVSFPGWDKVEAEKRQAKPKIWLTVRDSQGNVIRRLQAKNKSGMQRLAWDLRYPSTRAIGNIERVNAKAAGAMVAPGTYSVSLAKEVDGVISELTKPANFQVEQLRKGALPAAEPSAVAAFWRKTDMLSKSVSATSRKVANVLKRVAALQKITLLTPAAPGSIDKQLHQMRQKLLAIDEQLSGKRSKQEIGEATRTTLSRRLRVAAMGSSNSTYGPTATHAQSLQIATTEFGQIKQELEVLLQQLPVVEKALREAGAPWIEGQAIPDYSGQ